MFDREQWPNLLLLAACFITGLAVMYWCWRLREKWRVWRSRSRGKSGERRGLKVLKQHGFTICKEQVAGKAHLIVDGIEQHFPIHGDALVEKQGTYYIAEIKSSSTLATVTRRETRRQVMEYLLSYDVSGVVLVDAESKTCTLITQ